MQLVRRNSMRISQPPPLFPPKRGASALSLVSMPGAALLRLSFPPKTSFGPSG